MSQNILPISVQICTLNEESNIVECLSKVVENKPEEIIVIDGGSTDHTVQLATSFGVRVVNAGRIGLAKQRQIGIESTELPYIAIVDADDRIESDCFEKLFSELKNGDFKAIQANVQSFSNKTYWQKAWGLFCSININKVGKTNMVGRPALFERESIVQVGFDPFFTYGSEDTDISYRFEKLKLSQGIGTGISFRIHPDTFKECRNKWLSYGKGYARFAYKYPEKRKEIVKHLLWNIPIKRNVNTLQNGYLIYVPFYLLYSLFCYLGFFQEVKVLQKGEFKNDFGRN